MTKIRLLQAIRQNGIPTNEIRSVHTDSKHFLVLKSDVINKVANAQIESERGVEAEIIKKQVRNDEPTQTARRTQANESSEATGKATKTKNTEQKGTGQAPKTALPEGLSIKLIATDPKNHAQRMKQARQIGNAIKAKGKVVIEDPLTGHRFLGTAQGAQAGANFLKGVFATIEAAYASGDLKAQMEQIAKENTEKGGQQITWAVVLAKISEYFGYAGAKVGGALGYLRSNAAKIEEYALKGAKLGAGIAEKIVPIFLIYSAYEEMNATAQEFGYDSPEFIGVSSMWTVRLLSTVAPGGIVLGEVAATSIELVMEKMMGKKMPYSSMITQMYNGMQDVTNYVDQKAKGNNEGARKALEPKH